MPERDNCGSTNGVCHFYDDQICSRCELLEKINSVIDRKIGFGYGFAEWHDDVVKLLVVVRDRLRGKADE